MTNTTNLNIPLVAQNQAQKEVTVNEAISKIDAILNRGAVHLGSNIPPAMPDEGDLYIVGLSPVGSWQGKANNVAYYNTTWKFITPNEGISIWVNDENILYTWDGAGWINNTNLNNLNGVGINTSYDDINKLAVKSAAVLFDNIGDDVRVKISKNSAVNVASHLFQDNYTGRAEFGLIGDDNFQLKVCGDDNIWRQSFVVDSGSGNVFFKQAVDLAGNLNCNGHQLINPELKDYVLTLTTENSGTAYSINMQNGNLFRITRTGNCTLSFANPPISGKGGKFTLILVQDGAGGRIVTWSSAVKWPGGIAPTLSMNANAVDIITFLTTDGGATWLGKVDGIDVR